MTSLLFSALFARLTRWIIMCTTNQNFLTLLYVSLFRVKLVPEAVRASFHALVPIHPGNMSSNSPNGALDKALPTNTGICYRDLMLNHGFVDQAIFHHVYPGSGTQEDPYIVGWIDHDPRNPLFFTDRTKWFWTLLVALANMAVALSTSAYTAPAKEIREEFQVSQEVFELGLSVFVLWFAVGPFFWAPLSELYGRQIVFVGTVSEAVELLYDPLTPVNAVHRVDCFQCRLRSGFEYRRLDHNEIPGWRFWLLAPD